MDVEKQIDNLHSQTQKTHLDFSKHEAVCQERYEQLLNNMNEMSLHMKEMKIEINNLKEMALTGKVSLRTLIWVGSLIGSLAGIAIAIMNHGK